MPGTLHVVATPIGNLEDITLRALRVLREVSLIAAEDTRRSRKLLTAHGIDTQLLSYHAHNSRSRLPLLLEQLGAGHDVALVTDAGTPGVSDPGSELVAAASDLGYAINPVPGASAPLAAAVASGFPMVPLTLFGFSPHRSSDRMKWFAKVSATTHTFCFFESPNRMVDSIGQMADVFPARPVMVARELTKLHQELIRGTADELRQRTFSTRGEFTVVVGPAPTESTRGESRSDDQVVALYHQLMDQPGMTRRAAMSQAARASARSTREVYAAIERAKHQDPGRRDSDRTP